MDHLMQTLLTQSPQGNLLADKLSYSESSRDEPRYRTGATDNG